MSQIGARHVIIFTMQLCVYARVCVMSGERPCDEPSHASHNYLELGGNNLWSLNLSTLNATLLKVKFILPCLSSNIKM